GSAQAAPAALPECFLGGPQPGPAGPGRAGRPAAAAATPGPAAGPPPPWRPLAGARPAPRGRPPPPRPRGQASVRRVDLRPRLGEISAPALVCGGRHAPQTPWPDHAAIAAHLPARRLEV